MTYDDLNKLFEESASPDAWLHDDSMGIWTCRKDLNVTIRERRDEEKKEFNEEWAKRVPDKNAEMVTYEIYYGSSFVQRQYAVSVDGHRAVIPLPEYETGIISREKYYFGSAIDFQRSLDEYIQRCKLTVK